MKKITILLLMLLCSTPSWAQYTRAWSETTPADSDLANTLGLAIRNLRTDIRQRLSDSLADFSNGILVFQSQTAGTPTLTLYPAVSATTNGFPVQIKNTAGTTISFFDINGAFNINGSTSGTVTFAVPAVAGTTTITFPATSGTVLTTATGANTTLSNLGTTAVNAVIQPSTAGGLALGATALPWSGVYIGNAATNNILLTGTAASGVTVTIQGSTDTLVSRSTTDTLINKTIDTAGPNTIRINGNSLSATAGTATITVPNTTDTLVGRATTDTLSGKTISSAGLPIAGSGSGTTTLVAAAAASGTLMLPAATDTLMAKATTDTLTNKTLDFNGTGNHIAWPVVIWFAAAGCNNVTATSFFDLPASSPAVANCLTGTNTNQGTLDYADSAGLTAQTSIVLPDDWNSSSTTVADLYWLVTTGGGSNAAKWTIATACSASAATYDTAFNAAQTITTNVGTNANVTVSTQSGLTMTGCAAGNWLHLKVGRDNTDTSTATIRLLGLRLKLGRTT